MSIWMILVFALCMLSGVLSVDPRVEPAHVPASAFIVTLLTFLTGVARRGIRRPVV